MRLKKYSLLNVIKPMQVQNNLLKLSYRVLFALFALLLGPKLSTKRHPLNSHPLCFLLFIPASIYTLNIIFNQIIVIDVSS